MRALSSRMPNVFGSSIESTPSAPICRAAIKKPRSNKSAGFLVIRAGSRTALRRSKRRITRMTNSFAPATSAVDKILDRLDRVTRSGSGWMARCPAHKDGRPSLSISTGEEGRVLLKCFAGCPVERILDAIDCTASDLFANAPFRPSSNGHAQPDNQEASGVEKRRIVKIYDYLDESETLLFQQVRFDPKHFSQRRQDGRGGWIWSRGDARLVLYRLPELIAVEPSSIIWIFEGEKDVDLAVDRFGLVATTNVNGAGKWLEQYSDQLAGRRIVIVPDNDDAGRKHAAQVAASLQSRGCKIRLLELPELPEKGDFSDWVGQGGTSDRLHDLLKASTLWRPSGGDGPIEATALVGPVESAPRSSWPELDPAALYGLAGDVVRAIAPTTEADPVAILMTFLVSFGNMVNRSPHLMIGDDRHGTNLFIGIVGDTSSGRKGTSDASVHRLMTMVDEAWATHRKLGGLSTGEGLIQTIRDERFEINKKGEEIKVDAGEPDKRLLSLEEEFSFILKVAMRQGNTITEILRRGWDSRSALRILTKGSPLMATNAHVSIIAHITATELARNVSETDMANGFLNRYAWFVVRRSQFLPEPIRMDEQAAAFLASQITSAKAFALRCGEVQHDESAREMWRKVYRELSEGGFGLAGALTARAAPIVRRLSLIYALLDESRIITDVHLEAALAVWEYAAASVKLIFGDLTGDAVADQILSVLKRGSQTQTDLSNVFGRNVPASRIGQALGTLLDAGRVMSTVEDPAGGRGRKITIWSIAPVLPRLERQNERNERNELDELSP